MASSSSENHQTNYRRHPKHLRGKEIGLWYSRLSKQRKLERGEDPDLKSRNKRDENKPVSETISSFFNYIFACNISDRKSIFVEPAKA